MGWQEVFFSVKTAIRGFWSSRVWYGSKFIASSAKTFGTSWTGMKAIDHLWVPVLSSTEKRSLSYAQGSGHRFIFSEGRFPGERFLLSGIALILIRIDTAADALFNPKADSRSDREI
jgi:hypothetical protein